MAGGFPRTPKHLELSRELPLGAEPNPRLHLCVRGEVKSACTVSRVIRRGLFQLPHRPARTPHDTHGEAWCRQATTGAIGSLAPRPLGARGCERGTQAWRQCALPPNLKLETLTDSHAALRRVQLGDEEVVLAFRELDRLA